MDKKIERLARQGPEWSFWDWLFGGGRDGGGGGG